ncbi:helicase SNF2 family protein [Pseudonocardia asaccharolytica DSM 44247 = NBRC 16224]|uniref:Helicase SNF2 family protein n=1 Tax=Pseudonocardia asaccharolytica DSM 44247 = NBRC 16224 TaxID=1123024 RepID=A0A511D0N9_9PSEU|nr:helicase SNF2 family protein [Pseudonocardia asaccharolytica DSM 44247 = NBRC 16224]
MVGALVPADGSTCVTLQSVEDGEYGRTLDVIWEVEPGRRVLPSGSLPEVTEGGFDPPERLAAFLDAVRWSAVTSADVKTLQAPFRSGVAIEDYQLEPVSRAVGAPRVNLLLADDVGLGKTIEAGLVASELLLRNRARRIMIVCPAGLTVKWRDEMTEKFGLDFTVIDSTRCAEVRRTYGSAANPFHVFPLSIVSLPWLRGPKAQRLLDEVLPADRPDGHALGRAFDLLILDEAHHVAPAAPQQVYAVDSQQTRLIRRLAPHFTHRLFLSATPHNGYQASFTALLEILDDQRFARGVEPDRAAVRQTVVRRLKRDIVGADGSPRFLARETRPIPVDYPEDEREIHALLAEFTALRRKRTRRLRGRRAADLVTILLKKRLFSSPAAFAHTVAVYLETVQRKADRGGVEPSDDIPEWMDDLLDDLATYDDEALAEAEDDALDRAVPLQAEAVYLDDGAEDTAAEVALLRRMERWALAHEAEPDAKARELINYLAAVCRPDGAHWTNQRVVVFTEYRDTQRWLAGLLRQQGLAEPHLALLHGGLGGDEREQLRLAFQADPTEHPVRILLATDAASEGIDLQNHCHRLVNYDIPFNPNRLEQRIGRVDRYGQRHAPDIRHFVGTGWRHAVDSYEADLEFLARVATKVARMEADLGPVNAVLADAVQRRMLGERVEVDVETVAPAAPGLPVDADVRRQVVRLREELDKTVDDLGITPPAIRRVVSTALELARQQPLRPHVDERFGDDRLFAVPPLTGSWERASAGLTEKLEIADRPPRQLPVTFDPEAARGRDDVVLAHLNHPLVAMSTRLLRAAVSNSDIGLNRVTAVVSDDPQLSDVLVGAFSRFVLVGADGVRLHEEVLHAGGWAPEQGRFRRLENLGVLGGILDRALSAGTPASPPVQARLVARWPRIADGLLAAIDWRTNTREQALGRALAGRAQDERDRITESFARFAASLRGALAADDAEDALFSLVEATRNDAEREQYQRDRRSWSERLARLDEERERELAAVAARYADAAPHRFPVAVVFVVPRREAVR